jgi:hypothetical protein
MPDSGDIAKQQLRDQAATATEQAQESVRRSAELAGQIAETELDVARVQDAIAENEATAIGEQAREEAAHARRFAAQEQQQAEDH